MGGTLQVFHLASKEKVKSGGLLFCLCNVAKEKGREMLENKSTIKQKMELYWVW